MQLNLFLRIINKQSYLYTLQRQLYLLSPIYLMIKKGLITKYNGASEYNSARHVKLQKINQTFNHRKKPESAFTSINSLYVNNNTNYNAEKIQRKINMNEQIVNRRKENYLNTQYNRRLNDLKKITKDNKKIHERINSQKSLYSQDEMRKSSVSIRSLSRSSSRVSNRKGGNNPRSTAKSAQPQKAVTIQPQNIANIKKDNIKQFKSVFMIQHTIPKKQSSTLTNAKRQNRSFSLRQDARQGKDQQMGNMLHKIAQQMYQKPGKKPSYSRKKFLY